jgi:phospholipase C
VPPVPGKTNINTDSYLAPLEGDIMPIATNPDVYKPCPPLSPGHYDRHCDLRFGDPGIGSMDVPRIYGFAGQLGFRVPNFIISPFSRRHYVGHLAMDHTAVLHFVAERWGLGALTVRDHAQPDLLDFFDFTGKPWATPPPMNQLPVPPGVGGTCHADNF